MPIYGLPAEKLQGVYNQLKELANICRDDDAEAGGPPSFADSYVSNCDLAKLLDRETLAIDLTDVRTGGVFQARSDDLLNLIYSRFRELDAKDGKLDGVVGTKEMLRIGSLDMEDLKPAVVAVTLQLASGKKYHGSAFIVERNEIELVGGKNVYKYLAYTAGHVVDKVYNEERGLEVRIEKEGGHSIIPANVLGVDHFSDFAVIEFVSEEKLPVIELGDSESLQEGDKVITLGNRLGEGISATGGPVIDVKVGGSGDYIGSMIKVNDASSHGDSGGPALFAGTGKAVGIVFRIETGEGGSLSMLIPINRAKEAADAIIKKRKVVYGNVGYTAKILSSDVAKRYALEGVVYFHHMSVGGAGEKTGLKSGDILLAVDERDFTRTFYSPTDQYILDEYIDGKKSGSTARFKVNRHGEILEIDVKIGSMAFDTPPAWQTPYQFTAIEITPKLRRKLAVNEKGVMASLEDSKRTDYGLIDNSIITHVGDVAITTLEEFKQQVQIQSQDKDSIIFTFIATEQSPTATGSVEHVAAPVQKF